MSNVGPGALTCPKCQGAMRQYERSGVVVDQCSECRGIFLDRGELERLIEAEDMHTGGAQPPPPAGYAPQGYPPPQRSSGSLLGSLFGEHQGGRYGGRHGGHH